MSFKKRIYSLLGSSLLSLACAGDSGYPIVDTNQLHAYNERSTIEFPEKGKKYHGQDAQYSGNQPSYRDNADGTVTDLVTGLVWTRDLVKGSYDEIVEGATACRTGGYDDWRIPTIKELYSLIQFNGVDPGPNSAVPSELTPFIDDSVFNFQYGDPAEGERIIDSQFATTAVNVSPVMDGRKGFFGVNFADGRIKCYPMESPRGAKQFRAYYVRGREGYGENEFHDNGDGTVTDLATGLMWMKKDSLEGMDWVTALQYAESLELAGYSDWRLPNAKELHSILDYSRSPEAAGSAAIDPVFETTVIVNEGGEKDFGCYWTSTTHLKSMGPQDSAVYIAFGRSLGWMPDRRTGQMQLMDVHGAGSQRSDPKSGDPARFPYGRGPQGDVIRIYNLVRCVRGGDVELLESGPELSGMATGSFETRPPEGGPVERNQGPDGNRENTGALEGEPDIRVKNRPNFVFILADDMGWTGTSVRMDPEIADSASDFIQTPNLEKLASRSMVFSRAYAPGSMCTPSRAAILTGKTPAELHMTAPGGGRTLPSHKLAASEIVRELPENEITIAELLKPAGYSTAYFGKWHQGRVSPGKHGFDAHDGSTANEVPEPKDGPKDVFGVNNRAMEFIETQVNHGNPFYVQLSHWAVHGPFESSESSLAKFNALPKGKRHNDPVYAGMTYDLDHSIGILIDKLSELQLLENTFVIFMSDNGMPANPANPNNAPLRGGKASLYEGGIRVPLMISGPGIEPGSYCRVVVTGCDLLPTIAELAGIKEPMDIAGTSIVGLLQGQRELSREKTLLFHYPHYGRGILSMPQSAIIDGDLKLLKELEDGSVQLFDLSQDVGEQFDLSGKLPEKTSEMEKLLEHRLLETGAQMMHLNPDFDADQLTRQRPPGANRRADANLPGQRGAVAGNNRAQGQRPGPLGRDAFMDRFDKDRDGRVTREEFDGPGPRWQRLDADGDGVVHREEIPESAPAGRAR